MMRHWQSYALSLFSFMLLVGCPTQIEPPISEDPIAAVGHGAFVGVDGKEFTPDRGFILAAQQYYIDSMIQQRGDLAVEETQELIDSLVDDEILAQALFIDWLVENIQPENTAHITAAASAMRWQYVIEFLPQLLPVDGQWSKGIDNETAERLEKVGVTVFALTDAAGEAYIGECEEAGVPIPPPMFSNAWRFEGIIENEFISAAGQAELWSYTSESPPGLCLSLPRYRISGGVVGDDAYLMGLICLGTESSKACFWDNPKCDVSKGTCFRRNVEVDISQFVGGADLVANAQGVCSDCHAGENPFVVHPDKPAFALVAETLPLAWYDPLVVPSWPQNPGPTSVLDAVSSTGKCTACHRVGSAGRFPDVSTQLPYYCSVVLQTAVGSGNTMPPPPNDKSQFTAHISALTAACSGPGTTGVVVDFSAPDDRSFVSRPLVVGPLYACATKSVCEKLFILARADEASS